MTDCEMKEQNNEGEEGIRRGQREEAERGAVKRGRRLRQAVHISWLPLIIRAFS